MTASTVARTLPVLPRSELSPEGVLSASGSAVAVADMDIRDLRAGRS